MLSLVVLANKVLSDIGTKDKTVTEELQKYKIDYEIVYITTKNYNALNDIKHIVARDENKYLIDLADDTNKTSQIYVGLDNINGDSALVLDIDTNIDVITQVLQQYKDGCENVFVRKKENPVYDFFCGVERHSGIAVVLLIAIHAVEVAVVGNADCRRKSKFLVHSFLFSLSRCYDSDELEQL